MKANAIILVARQFGVLFVVTTVAGWGCNPSAPSAYVPPNTNQIGTGASGSTGGSNEPTTGGKTAPDPMDERVKAMMNKDGTVKPVKFAKGTFSIPAPRTNDFHAANTPLTDLGTKMDEAALNTKEALGEAETSMEVGGAQLTGKSKIKLQDSKTFAIEFYSRFTEATLNRIVSDGQTKAVYFKDSWKLVGDAGSPDGDLGPAELAKWPGDFSRAMFSEYETGKRTWGPLLRAWSNGEGGFKATVEEKKAVVLGKERSIYQVLATRKSDGAQVQIVVDGERFLPVTVRTLVKNSKGGLDKVQWSAKWSFGGHHDPSDFVIPVKPPGP